VRGVVADPEQIVITNGYTQALGLVCHALAAGGSKRIALEDPSNPERRVGRRARRPAAGRDRGRRARR
jgi:GntR family transcriptional regulator/MocR family aminotransferase